MAPEVWRGTVEVEAAESVFDLLERLIDDYPRNGPLLPLVVLQAAESDRPGVLERRVREIVHFVQKAQQPRGLLSKLLEDSDHGEGPYAGAVARVRELSEHPWENQTRSQYRPFTFPRSRLLSAIEQAASEADDAVGRRPLTTADRRARLLARLAELRWRPGAGRRIAGLQDSIRSALNPSGFAGAIFLAGFSVLLGAAGWQTAMGVGVGAFAAFTAIRWLARKAPPLLWLRHASQWFATTTFLAPSAARPQTGEWSRWRPTKSWETIQGRAFAVAEQFVAAESRTESEERAKARQFYLELRVLALLEDLRYNFRPRSLDLRRRKRTVPPVVFLPHATATNGGMLLLRAISNVRSRRSEVDPLLVLAAIPATEALRPRAEPVDGDFAGDDDEQPSGPYARYEQWVVNLSVGQSPSLAPRLPWILWLPLAADQLRPRPVQRSTTRIRRTATRVLWSRTGLGAVLAAALALGSFANVRISHHYCDGQLIGSNTDSVWLPDRAGHKECIGVATGGVRFAKRSGLELDGSGKGVTFAKVEQAVRAENATVKSSKKIATIVYAGPLTPGNDSAKKGLEELTGVYLYQHESNSSNYEVKIRVLLANGGNDMLNTTAMVNSIVRLAAQDHSIVGVVGMGRDTDFSDPATKALARAGLPVVDTTNSGSYLAKSYANYFGLAATDDEEAQAMLGIARRQAQQGPKKYSVVLSRKTVTNDHDRYATEQRRVGANMLREAGFVPNNSQSYELGENGSANLQGPVAAICSAAHVPDALYFAGRVEDIPVLMDQLNQTSGCSDKQITVYTGDDISKNQDTVNAPNVTVYYTSLAPMDQGKGNFYPRARETFRELDAQQTAAANPWYKDKVFASGQIVLAYEATAAMYTAASRGGEAHNAAETWGNLRNVMIENMPTGTVTFTGTQPYQPQDVHGIDVIRVWYPPGKVEASSRILCGRGSGLRTPKLTELNCPSQ